MAKVNDGGPAFPSSEKTDDGTYYYYGLTMRDWFAGQVIVGMFSSKLILEPNIAAQEAYRYADAMLKEREKE